MDTSVGDGQVSSGWSQDHCSNQTCSAPSSFFENEDGPDSSDDYESEDETNSAPSIGR